MDGEIMKMDESEDKAFPGTYNLSTLVKRGTACPRHHVLCDTIISEATDRFLLFRSSS